MPLEILSPCLIVLGAGIIIALERRFPYDRGQPFLREGFWNDLLWYSLIQSYLLGLVIAQLVRWVDAGTGMSQMGLVSSWPLAVQVVFFLVLHDLYIYWFHRLQHRSTFLWRTHEAHHSAKTVDWLSGSRSHSLEILINQSIEFGAIVLLGGAPEVLLIKGAFSAVWGMYIHSNINVRSGWLQRIINGPEAHRWHHSADATDGSFNFGTKLAIWDWLFGTMRIPKHKPLAYGLTDVDFPPDFVRQHIFAFRPFRSRRPPPPLLS